MLTVTTRIAGLYGRYCVQGERAELARRLMASDARTAVVQVGALAPVPGADANKVPTTIATGKPGAGRGQTEAGEAKTHTVRRGQTLTDVAQQYQCDNARAGEGERDQAAALHGPARAEVEAGRVRE